ERVHRADPDRLGRGGRARDAGEHREREHGRRRPAHRSTTSALATACVAAGTVQVPEAHRCHPNSSPAPTSTGSAESPYAGTCTSPKSTAEPTIATAAPNGSSRAYASRRNSTSSATAARSESGRAAALHGSGTGEPETFAATATAPNPHTSARPGVRC